MTCSLKSWRDNENNDFLLKEDLDAAALAYCVKKSELKNPLVSPLFCDPSGLPPLMIQVGGAEVLRDDSIIFAEKVTKNNQNK